LSGAAYHITVGFGRGFWREKVRHFLQRDHEGHPTKKGKMVAFFHKNRCDKVSKAASIYLGVV